ncbi:unnamed protein product [Cunninghamella blakesleeana]
MGVRQDDWNIVESICQLTNNNENNNDKTIPCFGIHPWYTYRIMPEVEIEIEEKKEEEESYQLFYESILEGPDADEKQELISHLPPPTPFKVWYQQLETLLQHYPKALVGEVGLDRSARILPKGAIEWHGVKPTSVNCHIDHQYSILQSQIKLAIQYQRSMSIHCVQSQGHLLKLFQWTNQSLKQNKTNNNNNNNNNTHLNICLHSFGGKPASIQQFLKFSNIKTYVSFSIAINARLGWAKLSQLIQSVPDDQLLIESDLNSPLGLDHAMIQMACLVARAKHWSLHDSLIITHKNWLTFTGLRNHKTNE